jgi:hypothetical protein
MRYFLNPTKIINITDAYSYLTSLDLIEIGNINQFVTWNDESVNVMYNIIILTMSCFTWSYFVTFMAMLAANKMKISNDLMINVISLLSGYMGFLMFGYYNITYLNVAFIIITMMSINLQMLYTNKFNIIEYAAINSILATIINTSCFLLILYKTPSNIIINLNILFTDEPIVKIIS